MSKATTVQLETPIKRGDSNITEVYLHVPNAGALRGLKLVELLQMDVISISKLVPRVSTPSLTEAEVLGMAPGDLTDLAMVISNFLLPKSERLDAPQAATA